MGIPEIEFVDHLTGSVSEAIQAKTIFSLQDPLNPKKQAVN